MSAINRIIHDIDNIDKVIFALDEIKQIAKDCEAQNNFSKSDMDQRVKAANFNAARMITRTLGYNNLTRDMLVNTNLYRIKIVRSGLSGWQVLYEQIQETLSTQNQG